MSDAESEDGPSGGLRATLVPNFIRRSFALKFAIVLAIMGLSVAAIGVAATDLVQAETQSNVQDEYESVARQEADILGQWIERNSGTTRLVSGQPEWTASGDLEAELDNELRFLPNDASDIHVVEQGDSGATIVASTGGYPSGAAAALQGRPWFNNISVDGVNQVQRSDTVSTSTGYKVAFASPVSEASGDRYIVVDYDIDNITESLQGADRAEGGFTRVVSADNTVMLAEPENVGAGFDQLLLNDYADEEAALRPLEAAASLRGSSNDRAGVVAEMEANSVIEERYTVGYAPVEGTDWVVLVHAPYSSVFGFVQQIQTWGLVATVVMVVLIGGVGAVLGWSTSSSIDRLTRKTDEMREGNLDVDLRTSRIDNIGRLYAGFASMRDSLKEQIDEAERARKEAEVSRAEAMEMNEYLQEKAEEFSEVMEKAAAGDLTERMDTDGENEAMDRIASEYNQMIEELEKTTGQLKSFADEVAESGDVVLQSAESVRDASEQVAESVQMISDDAYDQKERLATVSEDLDDLVDTLERIEAENPQVDIGEPVERFDRVASTLQAAADTSEDMLAESENVAGAAEEQAAELNEVSSRADQLKRYARPLGDILDRFETEAEHEFVFSGGPSQSTQRPTEESED